MFVGQKLWAPTASGPFLAAHLKSLMDFPPSQGADTLSMRKAIEETMKKMDSPRAAAIDSTKAVGDAERPGVGGVAAEAQAFVFEARRHFVKMKLCACAELLVSVVQVLVPESRSIGIDRLDGRVPVRQAHAGEEVELAERPQGERG